MDKYLISGSWTWFPCEDTHKYLCLSKSEVTTTTKTTSTTTTTTTTTLTTTTDINVVQRKFECVSWHEGAAYWKWEWEVPDACVGMKSK